MIVDGSQFQKEQVFGLTIFHCTLQGVLLTMICGTLVSRPGDSIWLRAYIVVINSIALLQTIFHVIQGFNNVHEQPPYYWIQVLIPRLTALLSASVQLFFIHRCWKIFRRKWLPMVPFFALFLAALIPGVALGTYTYPALSVADDKLASIKVHCMVYLLFLKEAFETIKIRSCNMDILLVHIRFCNDCHYCSVSVADTNRSKGAFKCVHSRLDNSVGESPLSYICEPRLRVVNTYTHGIQTSAAPPLILMFVSIVDGFMIKQTSHSSLIVGADITGKFFVLSVMINLCGRNIIQEQLNQSLKAQSKQSRNQSGLGTNTIPVMIREEKTTEYELSEWPITPRSPRTDLGHGQVETHSEDMEAKGSSSGITADAHTESIKQPDLVILEEERLSSEHRLRRQV
ncbi:unnamed protein product [Rhizoctonia solani]|uniref:Uncharacterized protein n=1 Tax=Rhizoctonia solani TaxID=456999 RepID=A0A8H2WFN3_9AGAM|nr:unnamed protein product [Rhizoctonia solani]